MSSNTQNDQGTGLHTKQQECLKNYMAEEKRRAMARQQGHKTSAGIYQPLPTTTVRSGVISRGKHLPDLPQKKTEITSVYSQNKDDHGCE